MRKTRLLFAGFLGAAALGLALADPPDPAWWTDFSNGTAIMVNGSATNDYAPANQGQLKYVAYQARAYFNATLTGNLGGAGPEIDALISSFDSTSANYSMVTAGQLKNVAKPFYDRLLAIGYNTTTNLNSRIPGGWTLNYPWPTPPPGPNDSGYNATTYNNWMQQNYAPVNLGQLKLAFSFGNISANLTLINSALNNGLPNIWLTGAGLYPYASPGPGGGGSGSAYAYLDEIPAATGHNPVTATGTGVDLVVFTPLR